MPPTQRRRLCLSWRGIRGNAVALSDLTDQLGRSLEGLVSTVTEPFADTVVRLGVTGLSRAGKTVFLTGLVANLLDRGRMPQLKAESARRIEAAYLQPQQFSRKATPAEVQKIIADYYAGERFINVQPVDLAATTEGGFYNVEANNDTNRVDIAVFGNDERMLVVARLDNLGKGASGAAVQAMNVHLGVEESLGLV